MTPVVLYMLMLVYAAGGYDPDDGQLISGPYKGVEKCVEAAQAKGLPEDGTAYACIPLKGGTST